MAEELDIQYFSIPDQFWSAMSPIERWAANQKFLDRAIRQGAVFYSASHKDKVRPGSYLQKEIEYLLSQGYEWAPDGMSLVRR